MRILVFFLTGFLLSVILSVNTAFAADLTIQETIDYINQKLFKNPPGLVPLKKIDERAKSVMVSLNDKHELVVTHKFDERLYEKKRFLLCEASEPENSCESRGKRVEARVLIRDIYNKNYTGENPQQLNPQHAAITIRPREQITNINLFCLNKKDCVRFIEYQWGEGGRMLSSSDTEKFLSISMGPNSSVAEKIKSALYHLLNTLDQEESQPETKDPF